MIIQEMKLNEYLVEYRGPDSDRLENILSTATPGTVLKITDNSNPPEKVPGLALNKRISEKEIKQFQPRKNSKDEPEAGNINQMTSSFFIIIILFFEGPLSSFGQAKVIIVEPSHSKSTSHIPQIVVGVSQNYLQLLHDDIEELKNKMEEILELPNNATLIQAVR